MSGADFLQTMARASRIRVEQARAAEPEAALEARAAASPAPPRLELGGFDIIAELKLRSPAAGGLASRALDLDAQVRAYATGGAAAVSVLTEPDQFLGGLEHLRAASAALRPLGCPTMRKDFLTSPYQVIEARAAGAGGVLIIVTMLDDGAVMDLLHCARDHDLFVLLEGFDADDLRRIERLPLDGAGPPVLAGVNCRDLTTLQVDFGRFAELADKLPPGLPAVAESGIRSSDDARHVAELGFRLALVGSSLMQAGDPAAAVAALLAAGRSVVGAQTDAGA